MMWCRDLIVWTWLGGLLFGTSALLIPHGRSIARRHAQPALEALHTRPLPHSHSTRNLTSPPYNITLPSNSTGPSNFTGPFNSTSSLNSTKTTSSIPSIFRGVNIGGWLVLEQWMNGDLFTNFPNAHDQHSFDQQPGAAAALSNHWSTFFTEADVQNLTTVGINTLRIPIGYWAFDNANSSYISGAAAYLDRAIAWSRAAGIKVWVDLHGAPGSQNGFDNSGEAGAVDWQKDNNIERTISVLTTMARKYGAREYADTVVALELVNEPISWGDNDFGTTQQFARDAYAAVRAAATNPDLLIVMHDAFQGPEAWVSVAQDLSAGKNFAVDTHLYQNQVAEDNTLTLAQHVSKACGWSTTSLSPSSPLPIIVGEFSASMNICVLPDGTSFAGTSCSQDGCQCQSADPADWNQPLIDATRMFVEAQLDVFEARTRGWFLWSWKGPGAWGFLNGVQGGWFPDRLGQRKFPHVCDGTDLGNGTGTVNGKGNVTRRGVGRAAPGAAAEYLAKRAILALS
ncbi:MAG: basic helix-loop-helix protein [Chaenotheca gracillima]|nr:MAG: basic helix-loop-helix protein [Chaenotheca gracillima]